MRNRDLPALPGDRIEMVRIMPGQPPQPERVTYPGLSKREFAAIAIRAGLEASPHGPPLVATGSDERRMTSAEYAVQEADALFDEMEKDDAEG